jgi:peptidyl-prolyl cis-trans isomerase SurA
MEVSSMVSNSKFALIILLLAGTVMFVTPARAELLEEIVAWVNGDIITMGEMNKEEQAMVAEAYRRFTGDELDASVRKMREGLLVEMIDRKILLDRARAMFSDLEGIKDMYFEGFMDSQNITDEAEFGRMLEAEGLTIESFKLRLLEMYAPEEVLRYEVGNRISVSDEEVETYYREHEEQFAVEDEVTVREIVLLADTDAKKDARLPEAQQIVDRARAGEDFATLARELSEAGTKAEGGLLGELKRGDLSSQLEAVAFTLEEQQISDPIPTPYGFHILMVEERTVGEKLLLDDSRERLRKYLEDQKYEVDLKAFREKMRAEAEWCVKAKYKERIPTEFDPDICESM